MGKKDFCCAEDCNHDRSRGATCTFYFLPTDAKLRELWLSKIGRVTQVKDENGKTVTKPWEPSKSTKLCGCHFETAPPPRSRKKRTHVPTIFAHTAQMSSGPRPELVQAHVPESKSETGHHANPVKMLNSCSVDGCLNHNNMEQIFFHKFPKCEDHRQRWLNALNRFNNDGTPWQPSECSVVCSEHFVTGMSKTDPLHIDYVPSIFPSRQHTGDDISTSRSIQLIMQDINDKGMSKTDPLHIDYVPSIFPSRQHTGDDISTSRSIQLIMQDINDKDEHDHLSRSTQLMMADIEKTDEHDHLSRSTQLMMADIEKTELPEHIQPWRDGRRLVDLDVLTSNLENCHTCRKGPLSLAYMYIKGEERDGLGGYLTVMCPSFSCNAINRVPYSKVVGQIDSKGASVLSFDVNTKLTPAKIDSLGGLATVNTVLEALNLEPLNQSAVESPDEIAGFTSNLATADQPCEAECDIIIKKEVEDAGYNEVLVHRSEETQQEMRELEQGATHSLLDEIAGQEESLPPHSPPPSPKMLGENKVIVGFNCCVPKCKNNSVRCEREGRRMSFYAFPRDPEERKLWLDRIGRTDVNEDGIEVPFMPKQNSRLCSAHFIRGFRSTRLSSYSYYPTIFPDKVFAFAEGAKIKPTIPLPSSQIDKRPPLPSSLIDERPPLPSSLIDKRPLQDDTEKPGHHKKQRTLDSSQGVHPSNDHNYIIPYITPTLPESETSTSQELENTNQVKLDYVKNNDEKMQFYTNLPSYSVFKTLCNHIKTRTKTSRANNWKENFSTIILKSAEEQEPDRKFSLEEEIFIVLVKLKTGASYKYLSRAFNTSLRHISCLNYTWINMLCSELKVLFEAKNSGKERSESDHDFKNLKMLVDCKELFEKETSTSTPKDTVKFLLSLSQNFAVSSVSKCSIDRYPDNNKTPEREKQTDGPVTDETVADVGLKGFKVVNIFEGKGVQLLIPECKTEDKVENKEQQAACSEYISKAKIHAKEIIDRIKTFDHLEHVIQFNRKDPVEQIFTVCAYLTNFSISSQRNENCFEEKHR